jgi:transcriptional regulator with XRE-family HTH domain
MAQPRTLSEAIRRRRRRKRMTLREAARDISGHAEGYPVGRTLLHGWERGRTPGRRYLGALAAWLQLPPLAVMRLRRTQLRRLIPVVSHTPEVTKP